MNAVAREAIVLTTRNLSESVPNLDKNASDNSNKTNDLDPFIRVSSHNLSIIL